MRHSTKADKAVKTLTNGIQRGQSGGKSDSKVYYHVITEERAQQIIESRQLKNGKWESRVFAWTQQPTRKQASMAGIGKEAQTVISFETNASFTQDVGNIGKPISNIVV